MIDNTSQGVYHMPVLPPLCGTVFYFLKKEKYVCFFENWQYWSSEVLNMSNQNNSRFFGGKGYYIALVLCACAIGISGYVYSSRNNTSEPVSDTPVLATEDVPTSVRKPTEGVKPALPEETTPAAPQKLTTCRPVEGEILSEYAAECLSYNETTRDWRTHTGVDIGAAAGTAVAAAADGEVYTVYEDDKMGTTVVIRHEGGYTTKYASLAAETNVVPGETVKMGQTIGSVGTTALMEASLGDHVHFSVTKDDTAIDPEEFFAG